MVKKKVRGLKGKQGVKKKVRGLKGRHVEAR